MRKRKKHTDIEIAMSIFNKNDFDNSEDGEDRSLDDIIASAEYHIKRLERDFEITEFMRQMEQGNICYQMKKAIAERNGEPYGTMPKQRKRSILS